MSKEKKRQFPSKLYPNKECWGCPLRFECLGISKEKSMSKRRAKA